MQSSILFWILTVCFLSYRSKNKGGTLDIVPPYFFMLDAAYYLQGAINLVCNLLFVSSNICLRSGKTSLAYCTLKVIHTTSVLVVTSDVFLGEGAVTPKDRQCMALELLLLDKARHWEQCEICVKAIFAIALFENAQILIYIFLTFTDVAPSTYRWTDAACSTESIHEWMKETIRRAGVYRYV